jgi:hypothetical protein
MGGKRARADRGRANRDRERQAAKTAKVQRKWAVRAVHEWVLCLVTVELDDNEIDAQRRHIESLDAVAAVATDGSAEAAEDLRQQLLRKAGNIPDSVPISKVIVGENRHADGQRCVSWMFEMPNGDPGALAQIDDVHRRFTEANPNALVITCSSPARDDDGTLYWYLRDREFPQVLLEKLGTNEPGELAATISARLTAAAGDTDRPFKLLGDPGSR